MRSWKIGREISHTKSERDTKGLSVKALARKNVATFILVLPLLAVLLGVSFAACRQYQRHRLLASWTSNFLERYNTNRSSWANQRMRREGLRSVAPVVLPLLIRDLNYDPKTRRWFEKAWEWTEARLGLGTRFFGEPAFVRRERAAMTLAEIGPEAKLALPDLLRHTQDSKDLVRVFAAVALGNIGVRSSEVVVALTSLTNAPHLEVAQSAVYALWRLQPGDTHAAELMASWINAKNLSWACRLLQDCGESAKCLAPALRSALAQSRSVNDRVVAARTLWCITGEVAPALTLGTSFVKNLETVYEHSERLTDRARARDAIASAVILLSDIPEFRSKMKPLVLAWSTNAEPFQARWARQLLHWIKIGEAEKAAHF